MSNQNYMEIFMENLQNKSYRYERKYIIEFNFLSTFLSNILSLNFITSFPNRRVNNIYIDDYNFSSLRDNFDGLSKRNKYRIRWYGDPFKISDKTLEVKSKNEFLNSKTFFKFKSLNLSHIENIDEFFIKFKKRSKDHEFEGKLEFVEGKRPTLFNSYERLYFENKIQNIRLTIDKDLVYYSPITNLSFKEKFIIVEIKYDKDVNFINSLSKLKYTRYSKYVKGTSQTTFSGINY